jgi:hypothetical protein
LNSFFISSQAIASFVYKSFQAIAVFQIDNLKLSKVVQPFIIFTFDFETHKSFIFSFVLVIISHFISEIETHKLSQSL